jgi:hypothetical protein
VSHPACAADKHLNGDRSGDSTEQQETQSQCKGEPGFPGANHLNRYIGKRCPNTQQLTRSLAGGIALRRLKYHEALSSALVGQCHCCYSIRGGLKRFFFERRFAGARVLHAEYSGHK